MLNLEWRETALDDLDQIITYIGQRNIAAAEAIRALAEEAAQRIVQNPLAYRSGRIPGTREAVIHPNYVLIYRVGRDVVEVVNVLHARQQYP
jgi:toxin ParE1/3/4